MNPLCFNGSLNPRVKWAQLSRPSTWTMLPLTSTASTRPGQRQRGLSKNGNPQNCVRICLEGKTNSGLASCRVYHLGTHPYYSIARRDAFVCLFVLALEGKGRMFVRLGLGERVVAGTDASLSAATPDGRCNFAAHLLALWYYDDPPSASVQFHGCPRCPELVSFVAHRKHKAKRDACALLTRGKREKANMSPILAVRSSFNQFPSRFDWWLRISVQEAGVPTPSSHQS